MATQQINIRADINAEQFNSCICIWPPDHIKPLNKHLCEEVTMEYVTWKEKGKNKFIFS